MHRKVSLFISRAQLERVTFQHGGLLQLRTMSSKLYMESEVSAHIDENVRGRTVTGS